MKIYIADNKIISVDDEPNFGTYEVIEVEDDSEETMETDWQRGGTLYKEDKLHVDNSSVGYHYVDQDGGEGEYEELFNIKYLEYYK